MGLLGVANIVHTLLFLESDLRHYAPLALKINRMELNPDVLYIGESSNTTYRGDDADKSSIAMFIGQHLKGVKVSEITQPAGHAGTFKSVLNYAVPRLNPKIVVVTLNLRSFDAAWMNSRLEPSLSESLVLMRDYPPIVNRTMLSFKDFFTQTHDESDDLLLDMWSQPIESLPKSFPYSSVLDWENGIITDSASFQNEDDRALALHYIKAYAFTIDTLTHQRIADLDDIVEQAKKWGIKLCFNLMAENCEMAEELVGKELIELMDQNRRVLLDRYRRKGVLMIDNFAIVPDSNFVDRNWTTEHYSEHGRRVIAQSVAKGLADKFEFVFSDVNPVHDSSQTRFTNDCEGLTVWGGGDSISDEESFSGLYCSKTGGEIPYGLTFEFPLNLLPKNHLDSVHYSFVFKGENPELSGAVLQTSGDNPFFMMLPFYDGEFTTNEWHNARVSFPINDQIRMSKTIKLFIFTKAASTLYADDFSVEFE